MSLFLHQKDLTEHKVGRLYGSTCLSWINISTTLTISLKLWLKCYLQLGNNSLHTKKGSIFWLAKAMCCGMNCSSSIWREGKHCKDSVTSFWRNIYICLELWTFELSNKTFGSTKKYFRLPSNQNKNAWICVRFLPMEHFCAENRTL